MRRRSDRSACLVGFSFGLSKDTPDHFGRKAAGGEKSRLPGALLCIGRANGKLPRAHGLGTFYWLLVFLSGLTPLLFLITGTVMWWKKRRPS